MDPLFYILNGCGTVSNHLNAYEQFQEELSAFILEEVLTPGGEFYWEVVTRY
jgi:hypothetical protein